MIGKKENGRYIPLPATWLNGKRWEDELEDVHSGLQSRNIENSTPGVISKMQFSDSLEMYQEKECRNLNSLTGDLKGYDCEICKNKGVVYVVKGAVWSHKSANVYQ